MNFAEIGPILEPELKKNFDLNTLETGLFFSIVPAFYILGGILVYLQPKWVDNRVYIISWAAISVVAFLFCGPSKTFNFPNNIYMIAFGCALSGPGIS